MNHSNIDSLLEDAIDAFWGVITERFPRATGSDQSIEWNAILAVAAKAAMRERIETNVPGQPGKYSLME